MGLGQGNNQWETLEFKEGQSRYQSQTLEGAIASRFLVRGVGVGMMGFELQVSIVDSDSLGFVVPEFSVWSGVGVGVLDFFFGGAWFREGNSRSRSRSSSSRSGSFSMAFLRSTIVALRSLIREEEINWRSIYILHGMIRETSITF